MIGVFDSGHGGLTVMAELLHRFPQRRFVYFGDHAHAPYGDKTGAQIVAHTKAALEVLFEQGCTLVVMACNTASAAAARTLQTEWLPTAHAGKRVLGIIAPTVEAATQTPWSVKTPQFPQKYNTDTIALFGTSVTVNSGVFETEVAKRCPQARVVGQACPALVPLLERGAPEDELRTEVEKYVAELLARSKHTPEWAILGCTHYPLIAHMFRAALPAATRMLNQPLAVANALEDYLARHPEFDSPTPHAQPVYLTSGNAAEVSRVAQLFTGQPLVFQKA
ncbi:MAG TPA: glutamate racemase [Alphaproteobacteria bacterium]|nr:glutamate racemase [Alphaproteobacteria bacterium]